MRVRYRSGCVWCQDGAWYFRAGRKGKAVRLGSTEQIKNETQARKAAQPHVTRANEIESLPVVTLGAVIERYKREEMPPRECTARMYKSWLKLHIEPKWANVAVNQVTAYEVKLWLETLDLGGKSKSEIKGMIGRLLRCAMLWKLIPNGPNEMELFQVKGRKRKSKARLLTVDEFVALAAKLDEPFRTMVFIAQFQGLRVSEVLGLKWGDVNWFEKELTIQRSVVAQVEDTTKTEASAAKLPLDQEEITMLLNWRARSEFTGNDNYIFASRHLAGDKPYHYTSLMWKLAKATKDAGIAKIGTHTFRHTHRAWAGESGIPIAVIKDMMRHSNIGTTMNVYGGTVPAALREAHSKIVKMGLSA
jgi:integrase